MYSFPIVGGAQGEKATKKRPMDEGKTMMIAKSKPDIFSLRIS